MPFVNNEMHGDGADQGDSGSLSVTSGNLQSGTLVDYALAWSAPEQLYYVGEDVPISFVWSRPDGQFVQVADADEVTLSVTLPNGTTVDAGSLLASSLQAVASVEFATLYTFAEKDTHVFELTLLHGGQTLKARKTLIVY